VVTTAKLMTEVVTAASATITAADTPITAATLTATHNKRKGILVKEPKPLKKQAQIEQDEAYARELEAELNKNINWDEVIEQVKRKEKEDNVVMRYQELKRKPQTEAQARKNMITYLKNMTGFKMNYFKGMSYDDIHLIFEKYFNSNENIAQTLEITKLKQRVKKLERRNKLKVSKLRRLKRVGTSQRVDTSEDTVMDDVSKQEEIIATINSDEDVTLKDVAAVA
nr:hypothetical protein [Tanacetum cinerariifolium]